MMKKFMVFPVLLLSIHILGQNVVLRNDSVPVIQNADTLDLAWATGINAGQFSEIDINLDGVMDLFIFEANNEDTRVQGDKIYPFINLGTTGKTNYRYAPEYRKKFPPMQNFALCRDYNCDGKNDIFFRDEKFGKVGLYRNDSDTDLKFTLVASTIKIDTSELNHPQWWFQDDIVWMYGDLLGFEDIDNDGDIDIISSNTDGVHLQYNKNMSMETYGVCDSLVFKLKNTCWGKFSEDYGVVKLNSCDTINVKNPESQGKKPFFPNSKSSGLHSRNSSLPIDLDGDGDKDLLTGDLRKKSLYQFTNGGSINNSLMTSYQTTYPKPDTVNLTNFAYPFYVDVDNDQKKDLIVSVDHDNEQDFNSVWYYKNTGTTASPVFQKRTEGFLQEEMVDVGNRSKPVFFNYNGDTLLDLMIGNLGYLQDINNTTWNATYESSLAVYENVGTAYEPAFKLVDRDYNNISQLKLDLNKNAPAYALHPALGDLDGDGDEDMILGDYNGKLHLFTNNPAGGIANFTLTTPEFIDIKGNWAAPVLYDVNDDGYLDLVVGKQNGHFSYYENSGQTPLQFNLVDATFGDVNVDDDWINSDGYSSPYLFRDSLGKLFLLSGSLRGNIRLYDSVMVGDSVNRKFHLLEFQFQRIWEGLNSTITGGDLNNDGALDFVIGNRSGGLALYTSNDSVYIPSVQEVYNAIDWKIFPNPTTGQLRVSINCQCDETFSYLVYNAQGQLVKEHYDGPKTQIDTKGLNEGIYFLQATNKNRSINITERFLKIQ